MKRYDFWLVMTTIAVLAAMGLLAFAGTLWTWRAELAEPGWSAGPGYAAYTGTMNALVAPLVAVLIVVLGLCIPRRLFGRQTLWAVSAGVIAGAALVVPVAGLQAGIAVFLLAAGVLEAVAVVLTVVRPERVSYLKENVLYQVGSAVLHLGFVVLVFDWAAVSPGSGHLALFWVGSGLLVAGTALCFYREELGALAGRLRGAGRGLPPPDEEAGP